MYLLKFYFSLAYKSLWLRLHGEMGWKRTIMLTTKISNGDKKKEKKSWKVNKQLTPNMYLLKFMSYGILFTNIQATNVEATYIETKISQSEKKIIRQKLKGKQTADSKYYPLKFMFLTSL